MKIAERIVMVLLLLVIVGGVAWLYFVLTAEQKNLREAVARGDYEIRPATSTESQVNETQEDWRRYYPNTIPVTIGTTSVLASVADTLPERIKGLSDTPYLPDGVVKLFVFGVDGSHSIWMKDMNYPIDIIWVARSGEVVHLEEQVAPETYPESFASPTPAWYVIEANAGFVAGKGITTGDQVTLIQAE